MKRYKIIIRYPHFGLSREPFWITRHTNAETETEAIKSLKLDAEERSYIESIEEEPNGS